jgi:hypothetical protein
MDCFKKIDDHSNTQELLDFANNSSDWKDYFNFNTLEVPMSLLKRDSFYEKLFDIESFQAGILKMAPDSCYTWHKDSERGVTVNTLLDHEQSFCFFAQDIEQINFPTVRLDYQIGAKYLFDTQTYHMVTNMSSPRYLLSIEFYKDEHYLNYNNLAAKF